MDQSYIVAEVVGILTVVIAIIALLSEGQRNRTTHKTQLLFNLNEQWCSSETKILRKRVAQNLLKKRRPNYELGELLDFISMICYLHKSKAVDTELLSDQFSWWVIRYWLCAKGWVQNIRSIDPDGWKSVEIVANKLMVREEKEGYLLPSSKELKYFLQVEANLFVKISK
jgi:hypothetical protein